MNRIPAIAGVAAGAAWLAWYLSQPGRGISTIPQEVTALLGTRKLTSAQLSMVAYIEREFGAVGLSWLVPAAVANAYAESRLDPAAVGDNGHAIGLFQLNDASPSAAGYGMTVEERKDPVVNTRRIIEVVQSPDGAAIRAARGTATHAELASLFAQWAERCCACGWNCGSAELAARAEHVAEIYGDDIAETIP